MKRLVPPSTSNKKRTSPHGNASGSSSFPFPDPSSSPKGATGDGHSQRTRRGSMMPGHSMHFNEANLLSKAELAAASSANASQRDGGSVFNYFSFSSPVTSTESNLAGSSVTENGTRVPSQSAFYIQNAAPTSPDSGPTPVPSKHHGVSRVHDGGAVTSAIKPDLTVSTSFESSSRDDASKGVHRLSRSATTHPTPVKVDRQVTPRANSAPSSAHRNVSYRVPLVPDSPLQKALDPKATRVNSTSSSQQSLHTKAVKALTRGSSMESDAERDKEREKNSAADLIASKAAKKELDAVDEVEPEENEVTKKAIQKCDIWSVFVSLFSCDSISFEEVK